jgi:hypothetical protein
MKKQLVVYPVALGVLASLLLLPARPAQAQVVFQAAGPTAESIQGTVDAFRAALGDPNNGKGERKPPVGARSTGTAATRPQTRRRPR